MKGDLNLAMELERFQAEKLSGYGA